jgi:hypothetical protein
MRLSPEAKSLEDIQTKFFKSFHPGYLYSHFYSFALRFIFLQTHATSDVFLQFSYCTVYTVKEKKENLNRKPYPLPYGLRNPYKNFKYENSQGYAQKPQRNVRS